MKRTLLSTAGLLLVIDALWLLSIDKIHLGILLPLLIGLFFILTALVLPALLHFLGQHSTLKLLWVLGWRLFGIWLLSLAGFFAYLHFASQPAVTPPQVKAIIILGSSLENGQLSPTLKARLDAAVPAALANPKAAIIMTGGLSMNETLSEAAVMKAYMRHQHHLPAQRIYLEDQSTSTSLNLINSKAVLSKLNISLNQPITIISSDFHLPRAKAIAQYEGFTQIEGISAQTPLYIRYNSWLREYFAFLSGWLLNEY